MLREAGAKEVHVRVASPPTMKSCHYGIDTPTSQELIAANQPVEEIRKFIEADSLGYLSVEGMLEAFGRPQQATCTACFTGIYPVEIEEEEREKEHALDAK
jgi:amidophosphoribosyltransferase